MDQYYLAFFFFNFLTDDQLYASIWTPSQLYSIVQECLVYIMHHM